ncbi:MAG: TolC family protein [Planctomycetes bacterium]|nr:TolC family protein [Planctomycetota bacterium]
MYTIQSLGLEEQSKPSLPPSPKGARDSSGTEQSENRSARDPGRAAPVQLTASSGASAEQPSTVELKLAEARASAIQNNLDLQVQLVNPAIVGQSVSEEIARFQSTVSAAILHGRIDPPPGNVSFGAQADQTLDVLNPFSPGALRPSVSVPLTTGGRLALETGITRLDPAGTDSIADTSMGFSFSQPLLRGAGTNVNTAGIQIAEVQRGIALARTKLAAIRVLADVERAYWSLYAATRIRDVARQQLQIAQKQLHIAERLIQADLISKVDKLRAESGLLARQADLIRSETDVLIAIRELKRVMQQADLPVDSPNAIVTATDPSPVELTLDRQILTERAIGNRMEMFEVELDLLNDAISLAVQENAVLPRLDLAARYALLGTGGGLGNAYDRLFGRGFNDWFVGLVAEVPLPRGRNEAAEARRQQVALRRTQDLLMRQRLEVIIRQDVHNAVDRLENNWRRILAARDAVLAAVRTYKAELRLFEQGQRDSTDVLFAAERMAAIQFDEIRSLTDFELAKVDLALATGTMLGFGQVHWTPCSLASGRP